MAEKERSVFGKHGIVQVITNIICMHFLFLRIYFLIAMDDHIPAGFLSEYFSV